MNTRKPPLAVGDAIHVGSRAIVAGVWRDICNPATIIENNLPDGCVEIKPDLATNMLMHLEHVDLIHRETDCPHEPAATPPTTDLSARIAVDGDRQYALALPGQILTGQFMYVSPRNGPLWHCVEVGNLCNLMTGHGDIPEGYGPTPTAAVLALILARCGYESVGGIQPVGAEPKEGAP